MMNARKAVSGRAVPFVALFLLAACLMAPPAVGGGGAAFDASSWQAFLDRYLLPDRTVEGFRLNVVDYERIQRDGTGPDSPYGRARAEFAAFDPTTLSGRDAQIAFWVNAYNIGAVKMIMDHYPVDSIRSRKISFLKNPWSIPILRVKDRDYSLGEIEHEILLGRLGEPMAHFAIVCASLSCPELRPTAYTAKAIHKEMAEQAKKFLADPKKGLRIDAEKRRAYFSKIFKFDKKTFAAGARDAIPLIAPLLEDSARKFITGDSYEIRYLDYDWSLNTVR